VCCRRQVDGGFSGIVGAPHASAGCWMDFAGRARDSQWASFCVEEGWLGQDRGTKTNRLAVGRDHENKLAVLL